MNIIIYKFFYLKLIRFRGGEAARPKKRKTKFIKPIKSNKTITNKFITLDIETRVINKSILPYSISYYDGAQSATQNFYLSDYLDGGFAPTCLEHVFYLYL